ncbi:MULTISPECIES: TonB-dependent hemoglobin/transferrin/lactoferrin family receptor [Methylosinus]|uniref:TonB-dependent hemoglobin/transferrin/lactoferrin family receptor n=1 Tax=Methylosinus TaxID=425 RepID=UPI0002EAC433|nr:MULTISPECIES: TonB-dependent hemoglobin/transferrin/lactoferrin family receptor [Methylosinus]
METINVTATKTQEAPVESMTASSVVTRKEIERFQPSTLADILRNVPGVATQESQNDPAQSINIRGLQDFGRVNVLIDGARQNFQISGHNANGTFYLEPEFLSQADVVRGPVSNIYGSGAIGGVVSFRTRGADDVLAPGERYGIIQKLGSGTNGQGLLESTSLATRPTDWADAFGQFVYRRRTPYEDGEGKTVADTGSELVGGLMKLAVRPDEGHAITATALMQNYRFANNGTSGSGTRFSDDVDANTFTLGYHFAKPDVPLLDLDAKVYYTETRNRQTVLSPTATYRALGVSAGAGLEDHIGTWGLDVHNTARFSTAMIDHALTFGGDNAEDHVTTIDNAGKFVSALTPSGDRRLSGAFVQDEARYGSWLRVLGALRFDDYALSGGAYGSSGSRLSPKITVGVTPLAGVEIYGTYAEGYRAPSITETLISGTHPFPAFNILPNPYLKPEVAHDVEVGVNVKYEDVLKPGDKIRGKLNLFQNRIDNFIDFQTVGGSYLVPFIPGMSTVVCNFASYLCFPITSYQYLNVARAEIRGVEGEGVYDWGGGFLSVAGSLNSGKDLSTNAPLYSVAPGRITTSLAFRFLDAALTVGGRYTAVDRSPTTVTTPTKSYDYIDLFANYAVNDAVTANLLLSNVTNRKYTQYLNSLPSAGFTVKFAVAVKFASN